MRFLETTITAAVVVHHTRVEMKVYGGSIGSEKWV